jgi:hypothetical protein
MLIGNLPNEPLNEHGSGWQMPWMAAEHGRATVDELLHEGIVLTLCPYMQACEA